MNIAIVGAAYTGYAAAAYFRNKGHHVRVTTTRADRVTGALRVCNFRTGTIYGPGREHAAEAARIAGQQIPFDGESDAMIVHRDDVVRGLEFAIDHRLSGLYNLFNDVTDSKAAFFRAVCDTAGLEPITWLGLSKGPRGVSNQKIKSAGFVLADPFSDRETEDLLG
ncbi:MAG: hypothetical protein QNJ73_09280 [Gammaproteobacteria bacterium]|nr:hypothetical protein [Gammaproteobacteria bacterium]